MYSNDQVNSLFTLIDGLANSAGGQGSTDPKVQVGSAQLCQLLAETKRLRDLEQG